MSDKENKTLEEEVVESSSTDAVEEVNSEEVNQNVVEILPDVVASIVGVELENVPSIARHGGILSAFSGKNSKGIKIDIDGNKVKIDLNIVVDYGVRIPDVAFDIQTRVKKAVESMTGLDVREVNVHVQGIKTPNQKDEEESTEEEVEEVEVDSTDVTEENSEETNKEGEK